jgi:hypothetical protein
VEMVPTPEELLDSPQVLPQDQNPPFQAEPVPSSKDAPSSSGGSHVSPSVYHGSTKQHQNVRNPLRNP